MKKKLALYMILLSVIVQSTLSAAERQADSSGAINALSYAGSIASGIISKGIDLSLLGVGVGSWSIAGLLYTCGQEIKNQSWVDQILSNCQRPSLEDKM